MAMSTPPTVRPSLGGSRGSSASRSAGGADGVLDERAKSGRDVLLGAAECRELLSLRSLDLGWVVQAPVEARYGAREDRAGRSRPIADRDHVIELLIQEF